MPRGVASLGGSGVLLLGLAAFASILVSIGLAYGAWDLSRRLRRRAARQLKNERILQPPPRQTQTDSDTLELGNMFRKDGAHENEPFVLMPHNLASYLPSAPPLAHVSDSSPLTPPGLPPCKSSDSARTPILVLTNTPRTHKSVELHFGHNDSETIYNVEPRYQAVAYESDSVRIAFEGPVPGLGLGLTLGETEYGEFMEEVTRPETEEARLIEVVATDSPKISAVTSQDSVPSPESQSMPSSPFMTPSLPTLVITSASMHRGWSVEGRMSGKGTLPSPPKTPTLVLTSPSIHCGLDADPDPEEPLARWNDSQNWGDVLEAEEYDDEARALLGSLSFNPKQLETPPPTPTFLQMSGSRSHILSMPSPVEEEYKPISEPNKETLATSETVDAEKPFDYAAFHTRLAAFNLNHRRVIAEEEIAGEEPLSSSSSVFSSPSKNLRLDYDSLRARKRAATVSTKSQPSNSPLPIQAPRPARCAVRPRPLPLRRPGYI